MTEGFLVGGKLIVKKKKKKNEEKKHEKSILPLEQEKWLKLSPDCVNTEYQWYKYNV